MPTRSAAARAPINLVQHARRYPNPTKQRLQLSKMDAVISFEFGELQPPRSPDCNPDLTRHAFLGILDTPGSNIPFSVDQRHCCL